MPMLRNDRSDSAEQETEEIQPENSPIFRSIAGYLVSFTFHMALILVLALLTVPPKQRNIMALLTASSAPLEQIDDFEVSVPTELSTNLETTESFATSAMSVEATESLPSPELAEASLSSDVDVTEITIGVQGVPNSTNPLARIPDGKSSGLISHRNHRHSIPGVTDAGERAVAEALKWLARHQRSDGSWSFDHRTPACDGKCSHPGNLAEARTAATALALLPFLGAGNTQREGEYRKTVASGLEALISRIDIKNGLGDFSEPGGNLYSHGLASIVLCEAYAMSHDKRLIRPAQGALDYIAAAQDPVGGGWRYRMRQPGDTSVVGWQVMALKSGHMSYLRVSPQSIHGASRFLDSVQSESGAKYGYTSTGNGDATTAIGLLCRMHLGWERDHPAIDRGTAYLSERGPSTANLYYDYYASQVLRHYEGERWEKWDTRMRPLLVDSQARGEHEAGSWMMTGGDHGSEQGGRLYCTAMATMILEVYYRHMPLYRKASADEDFPLE